ncbi:MAG: DUF5686 family protein [Marinilabiliales bacterium]
MKLFLKFLIFSFITINVVAQNTILQGTVIDSTTNEPLAFVSIVYNEQNQGTITNIDGKFTIDKTNDIRFLKISYLGYNTKELTRNEFINQTNITIRLSKKIYSLNDIEVYPGINPAHRIIIAAQKNRDKNNPESLKSFKYDNYNKMIFTGSIKDMTTHTDTVNLPVDIVQELKRKPIEKKVDTITGFLNSQHLLIMETVSKRYFLSPDKTKEIVVANRVSGLKNPTFIILATQFQSFSFYNNYVTVMDRTYLNPLTKGSTEKYLFIIEDTLYDQNKDTVFIISFRPKRGKNFTGLKGTLHINTNGYAIQSVIAEPYEENPAMKIKIQQKYEFIDNQQWFPIELNTSIVFNQLLTEINDTIIYNDSTIIIKKTTLPIIGYGKSYISDIIINPEIDSVKFNHIEVLPLKDMNKKDEEFWETNRPIPLTNADKKTYEVIDSIGKEYNLDSKLFIIETLLNGNIPVSIFNINILKLMSYNQQEGYRLCLDVSTNEKLTKLFSVGGYFAYGFKDKKTKYGGYFSIPISLKHESNIKISAWTDFYETGQIKFLEDKNIFTSEFYRDIYLKKLHQSDGIMASVNTRLLRYFKLNMYIKSERLSDCFMRYNFIDYENNKLDYNHQGYLLLDQTVSGLSLKFIYKEKFFETPSGSLLSLGSKYPELFLNISRGLDIYKSDITYWKTELKIKQNIEWKLLGKTSLQLVAGSVDRALPEWITYNGHGSYTNFSIESANSFGTMRINEFMNDRFVFLFFRHNFKSLLFKSKHFAPQFVLCQNAGFGTQIKPEYHINTGIPMDKGYYESGILINNLLKQSYFGYGIGVFYRYGPYAFDKTIDNFSFKITLYSNIN